jgi:hypothetical protein
MMLGRYDEGMTGRILNARRFAGRIVIMLSMSAPATAHRFPFVCCVQLTAGHSSARLRVHAGLDMNKAPEGACKG